MHFSHDLKVSTDSTDSPKPPKNWPNWLNRFTIHPNMTLGVLQAKRSMWWARISVWERGTRQRCQNPKMFLGGKRWEAAIGVSHGSDRNYLWTPKPWKTKVLYTKNMGYNFSWLIIYTRLPNTLGLEVFKHTQTTEPQDIFGRLGWPMEVRN